MFFECVEAAVVASVDVIPLNFSVYPNPTTDWVTLDFGQHLQSMNVSVISLSGQVLSSQDYQEVLQIRTKIEGRPEIYLVKAKGSGIRDKYFRILKK
ncbi:MAG: T9SS type A sorting domain-containing protein [Cyclobacteriaceae bacterium]